MVRDTFLAVLLSTQLISSGFAQQPKTSNVGTPPPAQVQQSTQKPDEEDVVRITTNLVQVDAVITDNHGKLVTDLKPEEVQIFEDGRKQKINNFSFNLSETAPKQLATKPPSGDKTAPAPALPPATLRREDIKRTIAIVIDDLGLSFQSTA